MTLLCVAVGSGAAARAAEEGRIFNPKLSLTGGCTEPESVDPIADPSCPNGYPSEHKSFSAPTAVTTDSYGNIYVASFGQKTNGSEGRIDIFNSKGFYISQLSVPVGPRNLAVDSKGNLYVYAFPFNGELRRYAPVAPYEPAVGKIEYDGAKFTTIVEKSFATSGGLAIGPEDHLFWNDGHFITEFSSAAEGNKVINSEIGGGTLANPTGVGLAVDRTHKRIYAADREGVKSVIRVFELEEPHTLLKTIDGSGTPAGGFVSGFLSIAVDEGSGHIFVYDGKPADVVYEFTETGEYLSSINRELKGRWVFAAEIAVDNGPNSPNGVLNPFGVRFLFVPAFPVETGHLFAFGPVEQCPAVVEGVSFSGVSETEAELLAEIEPCGLETNYSFEYLPAQQYLEQGKTFSGAQVAGEGQIPAGLAPVSVAAPVEGLAPGTAYRFRVLAENEEGPDEAEGEFATYASQPLASCPNEALRTGFAALLPDCRAYELVTPPDTNARLPMGLAHFGTYFASRQASPAGDKASFMIEGGLIPGSEGTGSLGGDTYLATRGENGWSSSLAGPTSTEAENVLPGSTSPDQGYSLWSNLFSNEGKAEQANYVRYPDGHSALVGRGSLASDPRAEGRLISEGGGHIIFVSGENSSAVKLEENAPPDGTKTIYDRTANEVTHVVSLLPGSITPAAGQNAQYQGSSPDGKSVAFKIGNKLYLRFNEEETYEIDENVTFAGIAHGGTRVFYVKGGDLFAFDAESKETIRFTESGNVTPVNVAADGTAAYFLSPTEIATEPNPSGVGPVGGAENLYLSREGTISFVGTVTERDAEGEVIGGVEAVGGLGLWTYAIGVNETGPTGHLLPPGHLAADPSRTTPDGNTILFESRANLDGYDPGGHAEVYRYDFVNDELDCISCNPTLAPAAGEASLQSISRERFKPEPLNSYAVVANLRDDGRRAFFQSTEPLVPGDTDELQDVYEWEAQGVGSCTNPGGCVYLISSGHSDRIDYLYAVSDSGDNAFFRTSDILLGVDAEHTPSIYDARVEGGFAEEEAPICQGEGCRPLLTPPPNLPSSESGVHEPEEVPLPVKHCPKGKRKVVRKGKVQCVKKKHHRHKAGSKKKGGSK
ncbi:MAG: hypothetical protein ACTHK3_10555 [Solirubrobacterales bacterium]